MTQGFANIFIFACGQCNYPIVVCTLTPTQKPREDFSGQHLKAHCPWCPKDGLFLTDDAVAFQQVPWNIETRSQFHTNRIGE
jgi:hypothetical protein